MKEFSVSIKEKLSQMDFIILFCAMAMTLLSVLVLWGGSNVFKGGINKMIVQCVAAFLGLILTLLIATVDYDEVISKFEKLFFLISVGMILMVIVFNIG